MGLYVILTNVSEILGVNKLISGSRGFEGYIQLVRLPTLLTPLFKSSIARDYMPTQIGLSGLYSRTWFGSNGRYVCASLHVEQ